MHADKKVQFLDVVRLHVENFFFLCYNKNMTTTKENKTAIDIENLIKGPNRRLLEFEILLSQRDYELKRFKIYKKADDLLKNL
jgi:hypothetical protein